MTENLKKKTKSFKKNGLLESGKNLTSKKIRILME